MPVRETWSNSKRVIESKGRNGRISTVSLSQVCRFQSSLGQSRPRERVAPPCRSSDVYGYAATDNVETGHSLSGSRACVSAAVTGRELSI
ncbi:uncharacterized protein GLRG_04952 [Colletotrichum graminicola M1.001]|uniref:Uncharacterized protein n=1 Tax=Colletotrichum graminicola (strain M1.001 / M2 / FGSC 10212) TaxID=645133 RepID=E3QFX3_COLGM|nr:uncharacterized protein GLRG_04952 [Colletotrichum graminicola M1.001]EFQ29808.1 hypothetical protein GLRG_04952 [Colletotrichum graminicola M1.001]